MIAGSVLSRRVGNALESPEQRNGNNGGQMANAIQILQALTQRNTNPNPLLPGNLPIAPSPAPLPLTTPIPTQGPVYDAGGAGSMFNARAASEPIDPSIISRYTALAGAAPTPPPPEQPASFLQKLAAALGGVQAGFQGRGQEFVQNIKQERDRPRREFEQKQQRFEDRKFQLGLVGSEAAERAEERRQTRAQFELDRELDREAKRLGLTQQKELVLLEDTLRAKREREDDERAAIAAEKLALKQQRQQAVELAKAYRLAGAQQYSRELAERDAGLRETVSVAADKWLSNKVKLDEARARRGMGVGGGGVSGDMVEVEGLGVIPYEKYVRIQQTVGPPKRYIPAGGGGQFTIANAQSQVAAMEGARKTPAEINAAVDAMIKDNPQMATQLQSLKRQGAAITPEAVRVTIANSFRLGDDPKQMPAQLRTLAKSPAELAIINAEIRAAGLETRAAQDMERRRAFTETSIQAGQAQSTIDYLQRRKATLEGAIRLRQQRGEDFSDLTEQLRDATDRLNYARSTVR